MAIFSTLKTDQFKGLSNSPTNILTASDHNIQVNSIIVTSKSINNIQVNLQRSIVNGSDTTTTDVVQNKIISSPSVRKAKSSSVETLIVPYFLGLNPEGSTDTLICFSNAPAQKFDLQISYTILNETPFGGYC